MAMLPQKLKKRLGLGPADPHNYLKLRHNPGLENTDTSDLQHSVFDSCC